MLKISTGKIDRAVKTVVYGSEGIGKSTFASRFPDPLFIDTEGGTAQLDVRRIEKAVKANPTACIMTTEKDAQRLRDLKKVPDKIRERLFYMPVKSIFLTPEEDAAFTDFITEI